MRISIWCCAISALALTACSWADENEGTNAALDVKAGTAAISAPGFNMSVDLPSRMARNVEITTDAEALYPGAKAEGLRLTTDPATGTERVEIGFSSDQPLADVAKWYGDPHRSGAFKVTGINITDGVQTMSAIDDSGEHFNVVLKPGANGGTQGTLKFRD